MVIPMLPGPTPGKTTRDRIEAHVTDPKCASCHITFDPAGYAFENFDEVGRYRTIDSGKPVDTSGAMKTGTDLDGAFTNGGEFLSKIATSRDVEACFARRYFEYAVSRPKVEEDACSIDRMTTGFTASGDLKQLVASIATSDSFRYRASEGGTP
jgi:hypothetical protein